MSSISVATSDGRAAFQPGEEISVDLDWDLDEAPEAIELRLVWNTAGKGTTDLEVVRTQRIEAPPARDHHRLSLILPRSPYSFSGKLVSVVWALEAVALPQETSARMEIVIAPRATEVALRPTEPD
jgi:hypothetical protein